MSGFISTFQKVNNFIARGYNYGLIKVNLDFFLTIFALELVAALLLGHYLEMQGQSTFKQFLLGICIGIAHGVLFRVKPIQLTNNKRGKQ